MMEWQTRRDEAEKRREGDKEKRVEADANLMK